VRGGFIPREQNKTLLDQLLARKAGVPGVGTYSAEVVEDKLRTLGAQGGVVDKSTRVQEVEAIMINAAKLPGPGQYALLHDLIGPAACARPHALAGSRVQRPPSAIMTSKGITNLDVAIKTSTVSPGPCRSPSQRYITHTHTVEHLTKSRDTCADTRNSRQTPACE
jgi:hypothetical protein